MNETINGLFERVSVRAYQDRAIGPEEKRLIIDSAIQAPTAGNMALYTIIDVTDPEKKALLAESCDHQLFIEKAPLVLIFVADYQRWYEGFRRVAGEDVRTPAEGDFLLAYMDALIAAQNAVTAAWSLGIGSCYIGDIIERCETVAELLELPRFTAPAAMLCFGYPTRQQLLRKKPERFAAEHLVSENSYRPWDDEELSAAFGERGAEKEYAAYCHRKWETPFIYEMTRSAKKWLERWSGQGEAR